VSVPVKAYAEIFGSVPVKCAPAYMAPNLCLAGLLPNLYIAVIIGVGI
jgi:hypothetical protein